MGRITKEQIEYQEGKETANEKIANSLLDIRRRYSQDKQAIADRGYDPYFIYTVALTSEEADKEIRELLKTPDGRLSDYSKISDATGFHPAKIIRNFWDKNPGITSSLGEDRMFGISFDPVGYRYKEPSTPSWEDDTSTAIQTIGLP